MASPAFAQWGALGEALGATVSELSIPLLAASSYGSTQASTAAAARSAASAECSGERDCHSDYECRQGQCVARVVARPPPAPGSAASGDVTNASGRCGADADCGAGSECRYSVCTPLEPPVGEQCATEVQCGAGRTCAGGQCVASPPLPSSSLQRRGVELYLRERAVELREELALGRGPVIAGLARVQHVPVELLGRALRAHRAELVELIGDASGAEWSARFINRVEELCAAT